MTSRIQRGDLLVGPVGLALREGPTWTGHAPASSQPILRHTTRWLDVQTSESIVAESLDLDDGGTRRLGVQSQQTYERATVFLTPDQRKWLKETARALPVDGLSASDVVRLAVNRLRRDVDEGFALVEVLSAQAYEEAATHRPIPEGATADFRLVTPGTLGTQGR